MKKKIKGLVSLWTATALIAATIIPAAAANVTFNVYTGTTEPSDQEITDIYNDPALQTEYIKTYTADEALTVDELTVDKPSKYADELVGWQYWEVDGSGNVTGISYYDKTAFSMLTVGEMSDAYLNQPIFSDSRKITKQPTAELPTVEVTHSEDASYQWYVKGAATIPLIAQDLTGDIDSTTFYVYYTDSSYDDSDFDFQLYAGASASNDSTFSSVQSTYPHITSANIVDVIVELAEGWMVKITPLDGADVKVIDYNELVGEHGNLTFTEDNGSFYTTAPYHNTFNPVVYSESGEFNVKIEIINPNGMVKVSGETTNTLSSIAEGERYSCVISWEDGYSLTSNTIMLENNRTNENSPLGFFMLFALVRRVIYYDGDVQVGNDRVWKGNCAEALVPEAKDGYVFDGWYTDKELTVKFDFNTEIYESTNLYAKWLTAEEAAAEEAKANEAETDETVSDETVYDETVSDETVSDEIVSDDEVKDDAAESNTAEA